MQSKINKIKLTNFRNHQSFSADINKDVITIFGKNGSGKTNILEAISLLSTGRGLRGAKISDMSHFDGKTQSPWNLFIKAEGSDGDVEIGSGLALNNNSKDSRIVKINHEKQRGHNTLADYISVYWLTPAQDQTFADGVTSRRDYLDNICGFLFKNYNSLIGAFNNLKSQRRNLLLSRNSDHQWLNSIENSMAEKAISIAFSRNEAVIKLNTQIIKANNYGFPSAEISIIGDIENYLIENPDGDAESFYRELLLNNRNADSESGRASYGTHKSDFRVIHSDKKMPAELCSQGEQKAMLLSLTIATMFAKKSMSGVVPILLLDEVYAHLDIEKRQSLYSFINEINCQTWLTGTEKKSFEGLNKSQFIEL